VPISPKGLARGAYANPPLFERRTVRSGNAAHPRCRVRTGLALRIKEDSDDDVKQAIANKIIELAKTGERNPDLLCEHALQDIREAEV
jgi:hypothetical protein